MNFMGKSVQCATLSTHIKEDEIIFRLEEATIGQLPQTLPQGFAFVPLIPDCPVLPPQASYHLNQPRTFCEDDV